LSAFGICLKNPQPLVVAGFVFGALENGYANHCGEGTFVGDLKSKAALHQEGTITWANKCKWFLRQFQAY
jgi:hypothetical protein